MTDPISMANSTTLEFTMIETCQLERLQAKVRDLNERAERAEADAERLATSVRWMIRYGDMTWPREGDELNDNEPRFLEKAREALAAHDAGKEQR